MWEALIWKRVAVDKKTIITTLSIKSYALAFDLIIDMRPFSTHATRVCHDEILHFGTIRRPLSAGKVSVPSILPSYVFIVLSGK